MNFQVCFILAMCACAFATDLPAEKKTDKRNIFGLGYGYHGVPALHHPYPQPYPHPYHAPVPYAPAVAGHPYIAPRLAALGYQGLGYPGFGAGFGTGYGGGFGAGYGGGFGAGYGGGFGAGFGY